MDLGLNGKVVIVTGATKGIGRATAQTLAAEGARVVLSARDAQALEELAKTLRAEGAAPPLCCPADVTDDSSVEALVAAALKHCGRIDVLVNNAAGAMPAGDFLTITNAQWLDGWNQKVQAHLRVSRAVFPAMRDQGGGRIVNVLGTAARNPRASYMQVGAANAALANATRALAELGAPHGILVSAVAPSGVTTERWDRLLGLRAQAEGKTAAKLQADIDATLPLGRMARPQEVADVICFIASARASYVSGAVWVVDGASTQGVYL